LGLAFKAAPNFSGEGALLFCCNIRIRAANKSKAAPDEFDGTHNRLEVVWEDAKLGRCCLLSQL